MGSARASDGIESCPRSIFAGKEREPARSETCRTGSRTGSEVERRRALVEKRSVDVAAQQAGLQPVAAAGQRHRAQPGRIRDPRPKYLPRTGFPRLGFLLDQGHKLRSSREHRSHGPSAHHFPKCQLDLFLTVKKETGILGLVGQARDEPLARRSDHFHRSTGFTIKEEGPKHWMTRSRHSKSEPK